MSTDLSKVFTYNEQDTDLIARGWFWGTPECHFWISTEDIDQRSPYAQVVLFGLLLQEIDSFYFVSEQHSWSRLYELVKFARVKYADRYLATGQVKYLDEFNKCDDLTDFLLEKSKL